MRDAANTVCSGLSLAGRTLYALLSEGWTVLCFWPAMVFGLWDIARAMLVLTAGLAGGEESHLLGVYIQVLTVTVLLRLMVKVWQWRTR
ncbi:Uncharacterised protein [Cedecea neteri]|uniref:Uncharacterized protein n=1 Tax=Cedecea neteri TaxID=158822 RepID=A0A291E3B0_9ENTR|nr:hypothetical protein [Cedecea neteri]ATF94564.1 hypothetical protein CO704_21955 [Cedecea neteri]SQA98020.1 Uncharacterised protein [Cedecea neteri]